jgi:polysaccharide biosynthesis/export protein
LVFQVFCAIIAGKTGGGGLIMRFKSFSIFVALICLATFARAQEQTPTQMPAQSPTISVQPSSVDTQGIKNYLLGPGDVLDVRVFGNPELNAMVDVDGDGNISSLPFLETPIHAKCRTEKEVQKDITAAYAKYLKSPQISVRISERKSRQPVAVWGAVRQASRIQTIRTLRLNEIMAAVGGVTERAAGTVQILHTEPVMCPAPGEEADAAPIDGTKIPFLIVKLSDLKAGKAEGNPVIRPGDYIIVTEAEPVYVTGSVVAPREVSLRDQLTLTGAIAMAGGVRREAKSNDVRIIRQKPGTQQQETIKADYLAIKRNQKPDILLQPYDVIEVGETSLLSPKRWPELFGGTLPQMLIRTVP